MDLKQKPFPCNLVEAFIVFLLCVRSTSKKSSKWLLESPGYKTGICILETVLKWISPKCFVLNKNKFKVENVFAKP